MSRWLYFLLLLPLSVWAEWDHLFSGDEDPSIVHHVNVITGNLNLSFQDAVIAGGCPISLLRTYSSGGALERSRGDADVKLRKARRGWMLQGGWSLMPHTNMLIWPHPERKKFQAELFEPGGSLLSYCYSHKEPGANYSFYLVPKQQSALFSGHRSARTNPQNNRIYLDLHEGKATLFLSDGGQRIYRGKKTHFPASKEDATPIFYHLETEILPSQHRFHYFYNTQTDLIRVEARDPSGKNVYATVYFDYRVKGDHPFLLDVKTSDQKQFTYQAVRHEGRNYLESLQSNCCPRELAHYVPGRKGIGARISSFDVGGIEQFRVRYYLPKDIKEERRNCNNSGGTEFSTDKVEFLYAPSEPRAVENGALIVTNPLVPQLSQLIVASSWEPQPYLRAQEGNGEIASKEAIAHFSYRPNVTDVRDAAGLLTRYHYDHDQLLRIEYFDERDQLHSFQRFYWQGFSLRCRAMFAAQGQILFAQTFAYRKGNVVQEVLWGCLTGKQAPPLQIDDQGQPSGGECTKKNYTYYTDQKNLLHTEHEEGGPTYEYFYKPGTDLVTLKLTKGVKNHILQREYRFYNEENLLARELVDNGTSPDPDNLQDVTERIEKKYELNATGLPVSVTESYWDPTDHSYRLLKKTVLTYQNQRVTQEAVFDAQNVPRYTLNTEYDELLRVRRKTGPLGHEQLCKYDAAGRLIESKEVGSSRKVFGYDRAGRRISCLDQETQQVATTSYDAKGRILTQTDGRGNTTTHTYDSFGNRVSSSLPEVRERGGPAARPIAEFGYDIPGNLILAKTPAGAITRTSYNVYRKPTHIIQADGSEIQHIYNRSGMLAQTIQSDGTRTSYQYDRFQRMTAKQTDASSGETLSSESWTYDAFQMLSHTDERNLTTTYTYDGAGRKIAECARERTTTYSYDALGFLERIDNGTSTLVQKHNVAGLVEEQWEEDGTGQIENHMTFAYDAEQRKIQATRTTAQGEVADQFGYTNGKLTLHTDPDKNVTQIIYNERFKNDLGQQVLQKTTVDALGRSRIETHDVGGRLVLREIRDEQGRTAAKEERWYDRAGNLSHRISHVYLEGAPTEERMISWKYDAMGRVLEETEAGQKTTTFTYDAGGWLRSKILPSGIALSSTYDGVGRLLERSSSDGTVHDQYFYDRGSDPTQILDLVHETRLERSYNPWGQIVAETDANRNQFRWDYDPAGRRSAFTLPDGSSVRTLYRGKHMSAVQRIDAHGALLYEHRYQEFDPNGHVSQEQLIMDLGSVTSGRDRFERPCQQDSSWMNQSATYNALGLIEQINQSRFGDKLYTYDALNQITREGDQTYLFDSLGNASCYTVNALNQAIVTPTAQLTYDEDGNPKERSSSETSLQYNYDALGRLTEVCFPQSKKVRYLYDPLSRIVAKEVFLYQSGGWRQQRRTLYLHDPDHEVGALDEEGHLLEFKTLGLGLQGDIGAAIGLELGGVVYAPLHDFCGNIVALIASDGQIQEQYSISAFGAEQPSTSTPLNPWRFNSKRSDEGLVWFGLRWYDPSLGRWLTPDPAGFTEGANLYVYVLNSPINRLDLFGLWSMGSFGTFDVQIVIPAEAISNTMNARGTVGYGMFNGHLAYFYVYSSNWKQLQFTPEELKDSFVDIVPHLHELMPAQGHEVSVASFANGINTTFEEFCAVNDELAKTIPGALIISRYNESKGLIHDLKRTKRERNGEETSTVCKSRQFIGWMSSALYQINPNMSWLLMPHSESGIITRRAIEGMTEEQQAAVRNNLLIFAVAPAEAIPKNYGKSVVNVYSEKDKITGFGHYGRAKYYMDNPDYDVRILPCISSSSEQCSIGGDHKILGSTYRHAWEREIFKLQNSVGFYGASKQSQVR